MRFSSVQHLIDELGGSGAVARATEKPVGTVASWRHRNALPVEFWPQLITLAEAKLGTGALDGNVLLALHAPASEATSGAAA